MCYFPAIGIVIGALQVLLGRAVLALRLGTLVFAAVLVLIPLIVSGGIHMDGFLDTMDALSSYGSREKKLEILKDSNSGAFAIIGMAGYLVWNLAMASEISVDLLLLLAPTYVISRALSAVSVVTIPSARKNGLVKTFKDGAKQKAVLISSSIWIIASLGFMTWQGGVMVILPVILAAGVWLYYTFWVCGKQFGGITGDLAGYFLQLAELAMLTGIVFAAIL